MANTVSRLQEQVETLFQNMNALRSETLRLAPIQDRILPPPATAAITAGTPSSSTGSIPSAPQADLLQPRQPSFRGPTSAHFTFDVAKNTLQKMGYSSLGETAQELEQEAATHEAPTTSPLLVHQPRQLPPDPLWEYDKNEMIRLCRVHEEEVGIMYPVANIESLIVHAGTLSSWLEALKKNFTMPAWGQEGGISDLKTLLLKMVMCCALVVEEHGNSERANKLFESVRPHADRMFMSEVANIKDIPFLALVVGHPRFATECEVTN